MLAVYNKSICSWLLYLVHVEKKGNALSKPPQDYEGLDTMFSVVKKKI